MYETTWKNDRISHSHFSMHSSHLKCFFATEKTNMISSVKSDRDETSREMMSGLCSFFGARQTVSSCDSAVSVVWIMYRSLWQLGVDSGECSILQLNFSQNSTSEEWTELKQLSIHSVSQAAAFSSAGISNAFTCWLNDSFLLQYQYPHQLLINIYCATDVFYLSSLDRIVWRATRGTFGLKTGLSFLGNLGQIKLLTWSKVVLVVSLCFCLFFFFFFWSRIEYWKQVNQDHSCFIPAATLNFMLSWFTSLLQPHFTLVNILHSGPARRRNLLVTRLSHFWNQKLLSMRHTCHL